MALGGLRPCKALPPDVQRKLIDVLDYLKQDEEEDQGVPSLTAKIEKMLESKCKESRAKKEEPSDAEDEEEELLYDNMGEEEDGDEMAAPVRFCDDDPSSGEDVKKDFGMKTKMDYTFKVNPVPKSMFMLPTRSKGKNKAQRCQA